MIKTMKRIHFYLLSVLVLIVVILSIFIYFDCFTVPLNKDDICMTKNYLKAKADKSGFSVCYKEGEKFPTKYNIYYNGVEGKCCEGLKKAQDGMGYSIQEKGCWGHSPSYYFCINCGNGICEEGEDWCNCPEDCKRPE